MHLCRSWKCESSTDRAFGQPGHRNVHRDVTCTIMSVKSNQCMVYYSNKTQKYLARFIMFHFWQVHHCLVWLTSFYTDRSHFRCLSQQLNREMCCYIFYLLSQHPCTLALPRWTSMLLLCNVTSTIPLTAVVWTRCFSWLHRGLIGGLSGNTTWVVQVSFTVLTSERVAS